MSRSDSRPAAAAPLSGGGGRAGQLLRQEAEAVAARNTAQSPEDLGDLSPENIRRAVADAMLRLQAGESNLAIHPNCGTNLATTSIL